MELLARRYAVIDGRRCSGCGECMEGCPSRAIGLDHATGGLHVDRRRCLACYCCDEICPSGTVVMLDNWSRRAALHGGHAEER